MGTLWTRQGVAKWFYCSGAFANCVYEFLVLPTGRWGRGQKWNRTEDNTDLFQCIHIWFINSFVCSPGSDFGQERFFFSVLRMAFGKILMLFNLWPSFGSQMQHTHGVRQMKDATAITKFHCTNELSFEMHLIARPRKLLVPALLMLKICIQMQWLNWWLAMLRIFTLQWKMMPIITPKIDTKLFVAEEMKRESRSFGIILFWSAMQFAWQMERGTFCYGR